MESAGLLRLVRDGVNRPAKRMTAKAYVKKHQDLIFTALDDGANYADIRAALAEDGVIIGAQYFKELMLDLKKKQYGYKPTRTGAKMRKLEREKARAVVPAPEPIRDPHTVDLIEGKTDMEKAVTVTPEPKKSLLDEARQKYKDKPAAPMLDGAEAARRAKEAVKPAEAAPVESVQEVLGEVAQAGNMSKEDAMGFLRRLAGRVK